MYDVEKILLENNIGEREKEHSKRVAKYAYDLGRNLGLREQNLKILYELALLHDIGKSQISNEILNKKFPLNDLERKVIRKHPVLGQECIKNIEQYRDCSNIVRAHHERWDGKGYPDGLNKKCIPFYSRIISIVDVYDAVTSERPYRSKIHTVNEALEIIKDGCGTQFDPSIGRLFIRNIKSITGLHEEVRKVSNS